MLIGRLGRSSARRPFVTNRSAGGAGRPPGVRAASGSGLRPAQWSPSLPGEKTARGRHSSISIRQESGECSMAPSKCRRCGAPIQRLRGRGRPRLYCQSCRRAQDAQGRRLYNEGVLSTRCLQCGGRVTRVWGQEKDLCNRCLRPRPPIRLCRRCGEPAVSSRHWYCAECGLRARLARREHHGPHRPDRQGTVARGYGGGHHKLRRRWKPQVDAGGVACGWCGLPIIPGALWDLSHPFDDKRLTPVPWHRSCNRQYASTTTKKRSNRRKAAA